jgi:large subunit ribosomal protein L23
MKTTSVIRRPVVTEKSTTARETANTLVFEVSAGATKVDVKRAVEALFGVKVAEVRTAIAHGKVKRQGRFAGRRSDWKKAYVRVRAGEKLPEFVEGA